MYPYTITFYSYKGGVGRTLLAANIGVLCARTRKTLIWDLDVEAPGLHNIPDLQPQTPIPSGLFEWLQDWQKKGYGEADYDTLIRCIKPTAVSNQLHILPAHGSQANAAELYQAIDWHYFLHSQVETGYRLFAAALLAFEKAGYETIILDARTGLTDLGGLISALLPHVTVLVGNYGNQNIQGLKVVWDALQPLVEKEMPIRGKLPPLHRLVVASPIPETLETEAAGKRRWQEAFGITANSALREVHFDKDVLFTDALMAAKGEADRPIVRDYLRIFADLEAYRLNNLLESQRIQSAQTERPESFEPQGRGKAQLRGKRFEDRVAHLLQLLGYAVEAKQIQDNANEVDLIASKRGDFGEVTTYYVECKAYTGAVPKEAAEKLAIWLSGDQARSRRAKGMLVAEKEFSAATLGFCNTRSDMVALTYRQLESSLLDFTPYLARLRQHHEASTLARWYVPQTLELGIGDKPAADLMAHAKQWARGEGSRLWLVLGDYGTGKSAFVQQLAYTLACDCETQPEAPIPLAINLKFVPNATTLEQLLTEHLRSELNLAVNPAILLHLLAAGRIVLLLDSFDEMGVATVGKSIEEQFRQLAAPTTQDGYSPLANRILITSRTHFFRDQDKAQSTASGLPQAIEATSPLGQAARSFQATLDELQPFDNDQIQAYLEKRLGTIQGPQAWSDIQQIYGLEELAKVPQLLDIILQALPTLKQGGQAATPGALYFIYTEQWLHDPRLRLKEMQLSAEQVTVLLETFSTALWARADKRIHYSDLATLVREHSPSLAAGMNHERVDLELRTAAFLVRSTDGYYRFSHKSFLEFFVARRLWQISGRQCPATELEAALNTARLNGESISMLGDLLRANQKPEAPVGSEYEPLLSACETLLAHPYRQRISENALLLRYYLLEHGYDNKQGKRTQLTHNRPWPRPAQLQGADLSKLHLPGINLPQADLTQADFRDSQLYFSDLAGTHLRSTRFQEAFLAFANLSHADARAADFSDTAVTGCQLSHLDAQESRWHNAYMNLSDLDQANFGCADLRCARAAQSKGIPMLQDARLEGATAPRAAPPMLPQLPSLPLHPRVLQGHCGFTASGCAVFSPDGLYIASGAGDGLIKLWDAQLKQQVHTFVGHGSAVNRLAFSPNGHQLASASDDGTVRLWDIANGQVTHILRGHQGLVWSAHYAPDGLRLVSAGADSSLNIWDTLSGALLRTLKGHKGPVTDAQFSPDGNYIASAGADNDIRLWSAASGTSINILTGHQERVNSIDFSPDGKQLVSASHGGTVILWDVASSQRLASFRQDPYGFPRAVFSPQGHQIAAIGGFKGTIRLWNIRPQIELPQSSILSEEASFATFVAYSPAGETLLSFHSDSSQHLWDSASGNLVGTIKPSQELPTPATLAPDKRHLLTPIQGASISLVDTHSGAEIRRFDGHTGPVSAISVAADGKHLTSVSHDETLKHWDLESGKEIFSQTIPVAWRWRTQAFSPNSESVAIESGEHTELRNTRTGEKIHTLAPGHEGHSTVAFSADGEYLAGGSRNYTLDLWDTQSGQRLWQLTELPYTANYLIFSPDGRHLAIAGSDRCIHMLEASSGQEHSVFLGHSAKVHHLAFSADGLRLLSASRDRSLRVWDLASGRELLRIALPDDAGWVREAAFTPDGSQIVATTEESSVRYWDAETGQALHWFWFGDGDWFTLDMRHFNPSARLDQFTGPILKGSGATPLVFVDPAEPLQPHPWIPRYWRAEDMPWLWERKKKGSHW